MNGSQRAAVPGKSAELCVNRVRDLSECLDPGPFSRNEAANALGLSDSSGSFKRLWGSCLLYGLIEPRGSQFELTTRAQRALEEPDDEYELRREIVSSPRPFGALLEEESPASWDRQRLTKYFARQLGASQTAAGDAAQAFLASTSWMLQAQATEAVDTSGKRCGSESGPDASTARSKGRPVRLSSVITADGRTVDFECSDGLSVDEAKQVMELISSFGQ